MLSCEHCQAQMLDHLYGLLDDTEERDFQSHIIACAACANALRNARNMQSLLGKAAKAEFPQMAFIAPAPTPEGKPETQTNVPVVTPTKSVPKFSSKEKTSAQKSMESAWIRWVVAATLLLGVAGLLIPAARQYFGWREAASVADNAEQLLRENEQLLQKLEADQRSEQDRIEKEVIRTHEAHQEIVQNWSKTLQQAREAIENKKLFVRVTGPEKPQPGAVNEWKIETLNNKNAYEATKIEVVFRDRTEKVIHRQVFDRSGTPPVAKLPVEKWSDIKSDSELYLDVISYADHGESKLCEKLDLANPVYVTQLTTDKPMYQPNQTVYFRSLTLERTSFQPPPQDMQLTFKLVKPDGSMVEIDKGSTRLFRGDGNQLNGPDQNPIRGVGTGAYTIPEDSPGGEYTLIVEETSRVVENLASRMNSRQTVKELAKRKFLVNKYTPEKFFKKLEFDGKSYGAGDLVQFKAEASRTEGVLKNVPIEVQVSVDGKPLKDLKAPPKTNEKGEVLLSFRLPKEIDKGEGTVRVTFIDKDAVETIVRPIPIIGKHLVVQFFPEGGDLVVGIPSRVYFQVELPNGKPADLKGYITDGAERITEVQTLTDPLEAGVSRGQGVFTITPKEGKNYYLKLITPVGIEEPKQNVAPGNIVGGLAYSNVLSSGYLLPQAKKEGVVLTIRDGVFAASDPVKVELQSSTKKSLLVGAYSRGRLVDHERVNLEAGKLASLTLKPETTIGGVTRVTVFEEVFLQDRVELKPVAERLVYRKPDQQLLLNVQPDKQRYFPGSKVKLDISAMTEKEKPTPAILMIGVINQSVINMADLKTDRLMPTHFLLASEVEKPEDLEHADFLISDHPKAKPSLDLLLGTQGWRRFVEQSPDIFKKSPTPEVDRLLVAMGQKSEIPKSTYRQEEERVNQQYMTQAEKAAEALIAAEEKRNKFFRDQNYAEKIRSAQLVVSNSRQQYEQSLTELVPYESSETNTKAWAMPLLCGGVLIIAIVFGYLALARKDRQKSPVRQLAIAAVFFGFSLVVMLGMMSMKSSDERQAKIAVIAERLYPKANADRGVYAQAELAVPKAMAMDLKQEAAMLPMMAKGMDPAGIPAGGGGGLGGPRGFAPDMPKKEIGGFGGGGIEKFGQPEPKAKLQNAPANRGGGAFQLPMDVEIELKEQAKIGNLQAEKLLNQMKDPKKKDLALLNPELPQQGIPMGTPAEMQGEDKKGDAQGIRQQLFERHRRVADLKNVGGFRGTGAERGFGKMRIPPPGKTVEGIRAAMAPPPPIVYAPMVVREYVHKRTSGAGDLRNDFAETVYWHPVLVLPDTGKTSEPIEFELSDDISKYQVLVCGHTLDGRIGAMKTNIEARKPFSLDPKLPEEINSNDRVDVAIRTINDSSEKRVVTFDMHPKGLKLDNGTKGSTITEGDLRDRIELSADSKGRKIYRFQPATQEGKATLRIDGTSPFAPPDSIEREIKVVPEGFPVVGAFSDLLENKSQRTIQLPKDMVPGSLKVSFNVYPSTLADLQKGLEGLLREPNGCFEQTSTSSYPNTLILDYLQTSDQANPEVSRRAKDLLARGYQKLISFECQKPTDQTKQGYEWFGGTAPPHEALTAYGLLQFKDMAKVYPVDAEMLKRTQQYLLSCKDDSSGGFKRNARALDSFGNAPEHITNAYIVWALTESDPDDKEGINLTPQLNRLKKEAEETGKKDDPYFLSLIANALLNRGTEENRDLAMKYLERVGSKQDKDGSVKGANTSITRSGGRDLDIETTAVAVLGWLKSNRLDKFQNQVAGAAKWIGQQRGGYGGFGSTQSTILALKALIAYTKANSHPAEDGTITLTIKGKETRRIEKKFTKQDRETIVVEIEKPEEVLQAGDNELTVEITKTQKPYPFSVAWMCQTLTPKSSLETTVDLSTKLDKQQANEGDTVRLNVQLTNLSDDDTGMATAIVGLPAGTTVPKDMKQLLKLRDDGVISYFELRGRELILYWRAMGPHQHIDVNVDLICETPGEYRGPASRGYLYYNSDHKHWIDPLAIKIIPAQNPSDVVTK